MRLICCRLTWCLLLGGFVSGCNQSKAPSLSANSNPIGQLPQVIDLDGASFQFVKKPNRVATVVIFHRTDCPIANRYAPEIRRLHEKYQARGVEMHLVYVDPREPLETIRQHVKDFDLPGPALRDSKHELAKHCQATVTPEAVVFDKDLAIKYVGRIDDLYADLGQPRAAATTHDLDDAIESTIQGRPIAQPRTKAVGCLIADLKN